MWNIIKKWIRTERTKLAPMTARQRLDYIWEYYKLAIIAAVIIVGITVSGIRNAAYQRKDVLISGIFINTTTTDEGYAFVKDGYWAARGADEGTRAEVTEVRWIDYYAEQPTANDANNVMTVDAMIAVGDLDYIIGNATTADFYGSQEYCIDLHDLLGEDAIANWNTYETAMGTTAIDLTGSRLERDYGLVTQSYIMFPITTQGSDRCVAFLEYLFS